MNEKTLNEFETVYSGLYHFYLKARKAGDDPVQTSIESAKVWALEIVMGRLGVTDYYGWRKDVEEELAENGQGRKAVS